MTVPNEMVNCFTRYGRKRHRLIALIQGGRCNKAIKKSQCFENRENTGFAIGGYLLDITK